MNDQPIFSRRLLIGWIAAAVALFSMSLYLMGSGEVGDTESYGTSSFSRSAIGHAGIADVLQRLGFTVIKSQYNSLERLSPGSVLVVAEPRPTRQSEESIRTLLKADAVLFVLPKWTGAPSEQKPGWLREAGERFIGDAQWVLNLVAPRSEVVRLAANPTWTTNPLDAAPSIASPIQLVRGGGLRPIIATERGMLLGEISERNRRIWVLADPDLISNHGIAREGNAALAVALFDRLRAGNGSIVFDETAHGYVTRPTSPFLLMFRFPFVLATIQGLLTVALLLWASLARFGAPQAAPPALRAGREGLLQNIAKLTEYTGQQQLIVQRYVQETIRDVGRQLHAPKGLSNNALAAWLQRVGAARGMDVDCGSFLQRSAGFGEPRRRDLSALVRLARDTHRWRREILDGRAGYPRNR